MVHVVHFTCNMLHARHVRLSSCRYRGKLVASAGNRTRAARVAGEHSTTEPPMLAVFTGPEQQGQFSKVLLKLVVACGTFDCVFINISIVIPSVLGLRPFKLHSIAQDEVAEWLRRWTANPLGSARVGSNPILVDVFYLRRCLLKNNRF